MDLRDISEEEFERIEAYLTQTLSDEDLSVFEERLQNEEGFAEKVEDIKTVLSGLEAQALKEQLDHFHDELLTNEEDLIVPPKVKFLNWKRIAVAAALIIAAGSAWFLSGNPNEKLYAKYFSPDPGLPTTMSSNANYEFYEAMVNYKQGDYKVAISKWEKQLMEHPKNDTLNYFIGVAYLADEEAQTAIPFLDTASKNASFPLINDTYYYLGLAYLKTGSLEKSRQNLEKSSIENSKAILSELKN
ncbi:tetratricopeptide repeat protein [Winogradskyella sp.]|uniref:tetratricopeptide repeat protein n=1 Tax=Winogradskyella sp. TaxID=1883156 RepID=UPI003BAA532F